MGQVLFFFFFSSRRRHTRYWRDWSSDVCSSDLRFKPDEAAPAPLAGKSTLTRLEHAPADATARYHKIGHNTAAIEAVFVDLFLDACRAKPPRDTILDLDATDDPIHGHQEGRFFHGYY